MESYTLGIRICDAGVGICYILSSENILQSSIELPAYSISSYIYLEIYRCLHSPVISWPSLKRWCIGIARISPFCSAIRYGYFFRVSRILCVNSSTEGTWYSNVMQVFFYIWLVNFKQCSGILRYCHSYAKILSIHGLSFPSMIKCGLWCFI